MLLSPRPVELTVPTLLSSIIPSVVVPVTPSPLDMLVLTINAGGSSIRLDVYRVDPSSPSSSPTRVTSKHSTTLDIDQAELLRSISPPSPSSPSITAVLHRLVHGGATFTSPTVISPTTLTTLQSLVTLDPLHNPPALTWIRIAQSTFPSALHIATFDTTFFSTLPPLTTTLPLPLSLRSSSPHLRRFGFHGFAHHSMLQTYTSLRPDLPQGGRLLTLQLGSGCSITALRNGRPLDTSMSFGPLPGLLMTTRTGDLDPAVITYLLRTTDMTAEGLEKVLYTESGLWGLSGGESKDMGELLKSGTEGARLAVDMFCYSVKKYVGGYAAALGGVDAVVFGGGMGEKGAEVRRRVCEGMQWMGLELDEEANARTTKTGRISASTSKVDVWVISVDEAKVMVDEARHLLAAEGEEKGGSQ